jgi:hypothetical protein
MSIESAFRSDHPSVIEWIDAGTELQRAWGKSTNAFRDDFPNHKVWQRGTSLVQSVTGLSGTESPGVGWRRQQRGERLWVADKRTKEGQAIASRLAELRLIIPHMPGMPDTAVDGDRWCHPGITRIDDVVWVSWSCPASTVREGGWSKVSLDESVWTEALLSEFYAAKEAAA